MSTKFVPKSNIFNKSAENKKHGNKRKNAVYPAGFGKGNGQDAKRSKTVYIP